MGGFVEIFVSGEYRKIALPVWEQLIGPLPPEDFINNGCTLSPDSIRGKATWPACVVHDYHYNSEIGLSRKDADVIFRKNLGRILKAQGMFFMLATGFSWVYYRAVRRAGRVAYNGSGDPR